MNPDRKFTVQSDINQLEETFRDAVVRAHEERYRKLRDIVSKLLSDTVPAAQAIVPPMPATEGGE